MRHTAIRTLFVGFIALGGFFLTLIHAARAATSEADAVNGLNQQIQDKHGRVKDLDSLIKGYQDRIEAARASSTSLQAQLNLLDDQIQSKQLGIERSKDEMDALTLEIQVIDANIGSQEKRIEKQKGLLGELVRDINQADDVSPFDVLLTKPSLSEFFAQMEEIKQLQSDLGGALQHVKVVKVDLEAQKTAKKAKQVSLDDERRSLRSDQLALEAERNFKTSLVSETQNQEQGFQRVVYELKQQQQSTADDISGLETKLKEQLNSADDALAHGNALFNWPVNPDRGITAIFHDPTYPFRYLFEHPGTDIRASVGTQVKAAAGGYVAWNKNGRMYGNYTMLVHPGGFATVYAHLSKFLAQPDTYVQRQDVIGMSGGRPGDPGAGLSTGPHLHFEVREDGIPVDAENFLPSIPNDDYDQYSVYKKLKVRP